MTMDELEEAWNRPLTRREVGEWVVDVLEALAKPDAPSLGELSGPPAVALHRLRGLVEQDPKVLDVALDAAGVLIMEFWFQVELAGKTPAHAGGEATRRALRSLRSVLRGDGRVNPLRPSGS